MFSATKFVVAGVIVALFGGLLQPGVGASVSAMALTEPTTEATQPTDLPPNGPTAEPETDVRDLRWRQLNLDDATFGPGARPTAIAASDSMVVIGGSVGGDAAIWTSTDLEDWQRVPHDRDVFGGPGNQVITAIVPWKGGFVAAGEVQGVDDFDPLRVAVVWISPDGTTWARVPHDEAVFGGQGRQEMFDLAATDDRLVIVGFDEEAVCCDDRWHNTAIWTSDDGTQWRKRTREGEMRLVTEAPDGFVSVGPVELSSDGRRWVAQPDAAIDEHRIWAMANGPAGLVAVGSADDGPAIWTSRDGTAWSRAALDESVRLDKRSVARIVAAAESGLVAIVGPGCSSRRGCVGDPNVLVSVDGATWEEADVPEGLLDAGLSMITSNGRDFVAVGRSTPELGEQLSIWTTRNVEPARDVETAVSTTTSDLLPGLDLVTKEVEPGVYRVLADGAGHDLVAAPPLDVTIAPDGSVWLLRPEIDPEDLQFFGDLGDLAQTLRLGQIDSIYRLGREGTYPFPPGDPAYMTWTGFAVDTDGVAWVEIRPWGRPQTLGTFDGSTWAAPTWPDGSADVNAIEATADGAVWVTQAVENSRGPRVARISDGEWTVLPVLEASRRDDLFYGEYFVAAADGTAWLANGNWHHRPEGRNRLRGLFHFDGSAWQAVDLPVDPDHPARRWPWRAAMLALGSDGTLWVYLRDRTDFIGLACGEERGGQYLARLQAGEWSLFAIPGFGGAGRRFICRQQHHAGMAVDGEGRLWVAGRRDGIRSFDGTTWRQYLADLNVDRVAVMPDGSVVATAQYGCRRNCRGSSRNEDVSAAGLYVITPEAVAGAG